MGRDTNKWRDSRKELLSEVAQEGFLRGDGISPETRGGKGDSQVGAGGPRPALATKRIPEARRL